MAILAAWTASQRPADIVAMVAWAFSLAAAGLFPALVLGIWSKRANAAGRGRGHLAGFGVTLIYLVVTRYFPGFGVQYLGMIRQREPGHRRAARRPRQGHGRAPQIADARLGAARPIRSPRKVGWFNVANISVGPVRPADRLPDDVRRCR